jgi:type II secretory pathway predicted ATPase ExeA
MHEGQAGMYETFFGLNTRPFADRPDPVFFVESERHAAALRALRDGLDAQQPIMIVTGDVGCGKTMLARTLLYDLGDDVTVGVITNPHASVGDLTRWALLSFGHETLAHTDAELSEALALYFVSECSAGRKCLLVVDEAQNLTVEALTGLQQYLDINTDGECLLQIMLVAEPRLLRTMRDPGLERWAERIPLICQVGPLLLDDVPLYVRARLEIAGTDREIFTGSAIAAVGIASSGVPRLINAICDMALVYAFGRARTVIDRDVIADVVSAGHHAGFGALAMLTPIDDATPWVEHAIDVTTPTDDMAPAAEPAAASGAAEIARFAESRILAENKPPALFVLAPEAPPAAAAEPVQSEAESGIHFEIHAVAVPLEATQPVLVHSEPLAAVVEDPDPVPLSEQTRAEVVYQQAVTGWPSISGRSGLPRFGRADPLKAGSVSGGSSLRKRFLPRN